MIIICNVWLKYGYNVEKYNVEELDFPWEKTASHFSYDYKFATAITIIHFAICQISCDNSNPVIIYLYKNH